MSGETDREAEVQRLKHEIARCKWAMGNLTDTKTIERLDAYLRDLQRALESQMSGGHLPTNRPDTD